MDNVDLPIMPGDRVQAFDWTLFKNDHDTPLSVTMKPATVVRRYGRLPTRLSPWNYPDLVDVVFDHRPERESQGHFTDCVRVLAVSNTGGEGA
jgi:hypothetical protein